MVLNKSTGILRYSPKLLGRPERVSDKWWLVLDCDPEIGRYYRLLYRNAWFNGCHRGVYKCGRPAWKEHVTVIRDEEPPDEKKQLWELRAGEEIEFQYEAKLCTGPIYIWLRVWSNDLDDIRETLGLPRQPAVPYHLTIGSLR